MKSNSAEYQKPLADFINQMKTITLNELVTDTVKGRLTQSQGDIFENYGTQTLYGLVTKLVKEKREKQNSEYSFSHLFSQFFEKSAEDDSLSDAKFHYLCAAQRFIESPDQFLKLMQLARAEYDEKKYKENPLSSAFRQFKETVGLDEERVEIISVLMDELVDRYKKLPKEESQNSSPINPK